MLILVCNVSNCVIPSGFVKTLVFFFFLLLCYESVENFNLLGMHLFSLVMMLNFYVFCPCVKNMIVHKLDTTFIVTM